MFDKVHPEKSSTRPARARTIADDGVLAGWLELTAQGDKCAFKCLYDAAAPRLFGQAMVMMRAREAAEDALQETFLRIWASAGHYDRARGHALAWMARIMRNVAIDHLRRIRQAQRYLVAGEEAPDVSIDPEPVGDRLDLDGALRELPPEQRDTIRKVVIEGWTHEEVAIQEGIPLPTIKSRAQRGLRRLRTRLGNEAIDWPEPPAHAPAPA